MIRLSEILLESCFSLRYTVTGISSFSPLSLWSYSVWVVVNPGVEVWPKEAFGRQLQCPVVHNHNIYSPIAQTCYGLGPHDAGGAYIRLFRLLATLRHWQDHTGTSWYSTYTRKSRDRKEEGTGVIPYHRGNWDSGGSQVSLVMSLFHIGGRLHKVVID